MPKPLDQLRVEEMNAGYKFSELQLAETRSLDQFQEASAKLPQICPTDGQGVVPGKGTRTGPEIKAKTDPPAWVVCSFAEVTQHGPSLDTHEQFLSGAPRWIPYSETPYRSRVLTWRPLLLCFRTDNVVLGQ